MIFRYLIFVIFISMLPLGMGCTDLNPVLPDNDNLSPYEDVIDTFDEFSSAMYEIWINSPETNESDSQESEGTSQSEEE